MCQECSETKACKVCGKEKSVSEYHSKKNICKICQYSIKYDLNTINDFSLEENIIILDNILNKKISCLNDFESILGKPLKDILINIQKFNIRNVKMVVNANCEVCGTEKPYKLSEYLNRNNYFCSVSCNAIFQSYTYGCKEGYQRCGNCNKEKPLSEFNKNGINKCHTICNVCNAKLKRNLEYNDIFTEKIVDIIFDSILNEKVSSLNELSLLINIELDLLIPFVKVLNIGGKSIKLEFVCPVCETKVHRIISQMEGAENHYCSKECYDKDQSMAILMSCKWCGEEFYKTPRKEQENYFCCFDCSIKYYAKERTKELVVAICEYCGTEFERKEYNKRKIYCSEECRKKGFSLKMSGKNNSKYVERLKIICDWCGHPFEELESDYKLSKNHFCCRECQFEYHAKVFSQTDEWKEFMREKMINMLSEGIFSHVNTTPQLIINNLLDFMNIKYDNEYNCKYYSIDNYLSEYNLMIEIMGTFWHCDNRKYNEINYLIQTNTISKDKAKNTYINKYYNIDTLYLWEYDIENNLELCKQLITLYIHNKGVLTNYHSFNYYLDNNKLNINNKLIVPYMEYDIKDLNKITDLSVRELKSQYQPEKHVTFNCEWCGVETSDFLLHFDKYDHHFCSRKCNALYYGNKKLKSNNICKECGINIPHKNNLCKVCLYKLEHNIVYTEKWTEEITDILLNNVLYKKIEYLNELEDILNIPLKEILEYMIKILRLMTKLRIQKNCLFCKKEFTLPPSRIVDGKDKFCSKECVHLYEKSLRIKSTCEQCGKPIAVTQSQYEKSKNHFCSQECANKWRKENYVSTKIIKVCMICGIEYGVIPSQAEKSVTCSKECQNKWQSIYLVGENANNYKNGLYIKN